MAEHTVYIVGAGGSIPSPAHQYSLCWKALRDLFGQPIEGIVAYQISALFRDGLFELTDVQWGMTPQQDERISVLRDGAQVWGTVVAVRRKKLVFSRAPDQMVDEVHFYEASKFEIKEPQVSRTRRLLRA